MTKKVIILSGYARSGKTTFLNVAKDMGCETVSTSAILHDFTKRLARYVLGINNLDTTDKRYPKILQYAFRQNGGKLLHNIVSHTSRDLLITVAEKCVVPVFGRDAFGLAAAKAIQKSEKSIVVFEAFNKEETDLMLRFLKDFTKDYKINVVTVTSPLQESGVDGRDLLHKQYQDVETDILLENNSSLKEYKENVADYLDYIRITQR